MELQQTPLSDSFRFNKVLVLFDNQNRPINHPVGDKGKASTPVIERGEVKTEMQGHFRHGGTVVIVNSNIYLQIKGGGHSVEGI
jgi:hypothetical protein